LLLALPLGKVREGLQVLRTDVPAPHRIEGVTGNRRQEQRITVHVLLGLLPLFNGRDLGLQDVLRRQRISRDEQDEDVAGAELALDLGVPIVPAAHDLVDPHVDLLLNDAGPQEIVDERQPLHRVRRGRSRLVFMRIADKNGRLRHAPAPPKMAHHPLRQGAPQGRRGANLDLNRRDCGVIARRLGVLV